MANDWETTAKEAAQKFADILKNAGQLKVVTNYVEVGGDAVNAANAVRLAASTTIELDGDTESAVPVQRTTTGALQINSDLHAVHQQNVNAAITYRAQLLNALLSAVQSRLR